MSHLFRPGGLFQDHRCRDEGDHEERSAVNRVYALLLLKSSDPDKYESEVRFGERYTVNWDEPTMPESRKG